MSLIAWLAVALIFAVIAYKMLGRLNRGVLLDIGLGMFGALIGSWLFGLFGSAQPGGFGQDSLLVEVIGAAAALVVFHAAYNPTR